MPANKGNLSTPHKEKAGNGLTTGASKKKKRCTVKHKKHCKQYLMVRINKNDVSAIGYVARMSRIETRRVCSPLPMHGPSVMGCNNRSVQACCGAGRDAIFISTFFCRLMKTDAETTE